MPTKVSDAEFQPVEEQQEIQEPAGGYDIKFLEDVYLPVSIELSRTKMAIENIVQLEKGSVIEFDKLAGETVDLLVNDRKFAEGEVVVIDEHFGIRITGLYKTRDLLLGSK
jgi:flagellar motor switch protein FliN/FliY